MSETAKDEIQRLLAQLQRAPVSGLSRLALKAGAGYGVMALFTVAALCYSSANLYLVNKAARLRMAQTDLPAAAALIKLRSSLLAQENFAGKYAIFHDRTFVTLFRQRDSDAGVNLGVLERTLPAPSLATLKRHHLDYRTAAERLFAGKAPDREQRHAAALQLIATLDGLYLERQGKLQAALDRADQLQRSAIWWGIGICCAGFLLATLIARVTVFRLLGALGKLQKETSLLASGNFSRLPLVAALPELNHLTDDLNRLSARVTEMEQQSQEALPETRLPGARAIERVLEARLKAGLPFSCCHLELDNCQSFLARYGYAKAGELLRDTGVLIHKAVRRFGAPDDFAGHAGGGSFVIVTAPERSASVCETIVSEFDSDVVRQLSPEEGESGGIRSSDRDGTRGPLPFPTVSIAVLDCCGQTHASAVEIARAAVEVRESLQKEPGSYWQRALKSPGR